MFIALHITAIFSLALASHDEFQCASPATPAVAATMGGLECAVYRFARMEKKMVPTRWQNNLCKQRTRNKPVARPVFQGWQKFLGRKIWHVICKVAS